MSVDLLNIARSGVLAAQSQLGVTSNNIANVNADGYHRQVATPSSTLSQKFGGNYYGTGTYIADVKRVYNEYAEREFRLGQTSLSGAETSAAKLDELDQLFSQIGTIVPDSLREFFAGLNNIADTPADVGIRSLALNNANQVATSLNQMHTNLDEQMTLIQDEITEITDRINEIGAELATINVALMSTVGEDSQLLDHQDALIRELSEYAQVNVIENDNRAKSIMLGSSVMLVAAEVSMTMGVTSGDPYSEELQLTSTSTNLTVTVDPTKLGGQLGALFEHRDETLIPAGLELDLLALGISSSFNDMQAEGFDLDGEVGTNIFTDINDDAVNINRVAGYSRNTGTASLDVTIDDTSLLTGSSYELTFTSSSTYELEDTQTGEIVSLALNSAGTGLDTDLGFSIDIASGAMASGDSFLVRPTAGASYGIGVEMTDPRKIAAAAPVITEDAANSGDTSISLTSIDDRTDADFPITGSEITIELNTAASTYELFDASGTSLGAATAYTAPSISVAGFTFEIDSTATATADRFTFDLSFAEGDNTNAVALAELSETKVMSSGTQTLEDVFQDTKLNIGGKAKAAEVQAMAAEAVYQQAYARVEAESGVNLDEEAANLIRFQQYYQAAARIMSTSQATFESLLTSVR